MIVTVTILIGLLQVAMASAIANQQPALSRQPAQSPGSVMPAKLEWNQ